MRRLLLLALLIPLASACGWSPFPSGHSSAQGSSAHTWVSTTPLQTYVTAPSSVPRWIKVEHLPKKALPGALLFATTGCTACHVYAGSGGSNLNAPALTAIGRRHLGIRFQIAHLKCPSCVNPGSPMPPFASLGAKRLKQLALFLEASKGTH